MGVVTEEGIGHVPGLRLVTPTTRTGLPIVTGNYSNILNLPTFLVFIGHLIRIDGDTHNQEVAQGHFYREENHHQGGINKFIIILIYIFLILDVRREGGIIHTVPVQRERGVVRNLKKTRSTSEGLLLSPPQSLLHLKVINE